MEVSEEMNSLVPQIVDREGASVNINFEQSNDADLQSPSPTLRRPPRYKRDNSLPFERDKLLDSLYSDNFIEVLESLQRLLYSLDDSSDDSASDSGNEDSGSTKSGGSNDDEIYINADFSETNEKGLFEIMQCLLHLINSTKKPDIIRAKSIAAVSVLYQLDTNLNDSTYTTFLNSLLTLGQSSHHSYVILREICRAFYHCLVYKPHIIRNFYQEVCNLMIDLVTDKFHHGHELTKPATEFWRVLTESIYIIEDRHLIYLVPTLYENTQLPNKYDAKLVDLTIQCILSKFELYEDLLSTLPLELREKIFAQQKHDTLYFRLAEDEHWSLRRRSVATMAGLATRYTIKVVNLLFPFLKKHLVAHNGYHYSWQERECVCFVIGALGGCSLELTGKLPHTLEFLVHQYYEKPPKLQSTSLWAIGRHTLSILQTPKMVPHIIKTILKAVQDENTMVAHSAILTLSTLCEEAHEVVMPYTNEVMGVLSNVTRYYEYGSFTKHSLYYSLMDCISDAVRNLSIGTQLPSDSTIMLGESLWMRLCEFMRSNDEKMTLTTLDCFGTLLSADSKAFRGFNNRLFSTCKELLSYYTAEKEWAMYKNEERLNTVIYVLDTMADSCIMDINSCSSFFDMYLPIWVSHPNTAVLQNTFALIGDLAKNEYLRDFNVGPLLPIFAQNLICDSNMPSKKIMVVSNVAWALGELVVRKYREMTSHMTEFVNALIAILAIEDMNTNGFLGLMENSAITLGRFGLVCPQFLAHRIEEFIGNWCISMRNVRDSFPKEQAFIGICNIIDLNLNSIHANKYEAICDAFLSWNVTSSELNGRFVKILDHLKGKNEWSAQVGRFPPPLITLLSLKYGI